MYTSTYHPGLSLGNGGFSHSGRLSSSVNNPNNSDNNMDMPKGQSDVHSSSLRLPFSMIVDYVNWTIKSN